MSDDTPTQRLEPGDLVTEAEAPDAPYPRPERALLVLREATWSVGIGRAVRHLELQDPVGGGAFWTGEGHWRLLSRPED